MERLNLQNLSVKEAADLIGAPDEETLKILDAAWTLRRTHFGNTVKVNALSNSKGGLCTEDCHYCSQSVHADSGFKPYSLTPAPQLFSQAEKAKSSGARRFCMSVAARSASWSDVDELCIAAKKIKSELDMEVCVTLGLMTGPVGQEKLGRLKEAGVDSYNHNFNTHEDLYPSICTTHTYGDRLETLRNAKSAGLSTCSGLIVGMGETDLQLAELAFTLKREGAYSIPINFLIPVPGTSLSRENSLQDLTPWKCLRILSVFRLVNPQAEIRASAGREEHLRSLQPLALLAANSIFLGGYLTQGQRAMSEDWSMIGDLGMVGVQNSFSSNEEVVV